MAILPVLGAAGKIAARLAGKLARNPVKTAAAVHVADSLLAPEDDWEYWGVREHLGAYSTAIERIGYNKGTQQMRIVFKEKTPPYPEYEWDGVPQHLVTSFLTSDSKGKFYHRWFKEQSFKGPSDWVPINRRRIN